MRALELLAEVPLARLPLRRRLQRRNWRSLFDFAGQQIVWWSTVGLVRSGHPYLSVLLALAFVAVSAWVGGSAVLKLATVGVLLGAVLDSALVHIGAVGFPSEPGSAITTLWMLGLWAAFSVAFLGSMGWLARRGPLSAALFGALAGVLAYRAGASLGVLAVGNGVGSMAAIALSWALALPVLAATAQRLAARTDGAGR